MERVSFKVKSPHDRRIISKAHGALGHLRERGVDINVSSHETYKPPSIPEYAVTSPPRNIVGNRVLQHAEKKAREEGYGHLTIDHIYEASSDEEEFGRTISELFGIPLSLGLVVGHTASDMSRKGREYTLQANQIIDRLNEVRTFLPPTLRETEERVPEGVLKEMRARGEFSFLHPDLPYLGAIRALVGDERVVLTSPVGRKLIREIEKEFFSQKREEIESLRNDILSLFRTVENAGINVPSELVERVRSARDPKEMAYTTGRAILYLKKALREAARESLLRALLSRLTGKEVYRKRLLKKPDLETVKKVLEQVRKYNNRIEELSWELMDHVEKRLQSEGYVRHKIEDIIEKESVLPRYVRALLMHAVEGHHPRIARELRGGATKYSPLVGEELLRTGAEVLGDTFYDLIRGTPSDKISEIERRLRVIRDETGMTPEEMASLTVLAANVANDTGKEVVPHSLISIRYPSEARREIDKLLREVKELEARLKARVI